MPAMSDSRRSDRRAVLRWSRMNSPRSCQRSGSSFTNAPYGPTLDGAASLGGRGEAGDEVEELDRAEGLGQEGVGTRLLAGVLEQRVVARREDHDLDRTVVKASAHLHAVDAGHHDVEQHH